MKPANAYAAQVDAAQAQRARIFGGQQQGDLWGGQAHRFALDPHRVIDENLDALAGYIQPDDLVIDVGGGAGRLSLPLALGCRQVINAEPSTGMGSEFMRLAAEAGISNATWHQTDWNDAEGIQGDVVITADVTYFVREIVPFLQKLAATAGRRVIIAVWSIPPPNRSSRLFRLVHGEEQEPYPGHRELLAVLWEMGILPDVRVLPSPPWWDVEFHQSRNEALESALGRHQWLRPEDAARARTILEDRFDELFHQSPQGFQPVWRPEIRELLITWETAYPIKR
jgi:cyclopropane fatty-acyl-phospholipid synthase-like methyltransferase